MLCTHQHLTLTLTLITKINIEIMKIQLLWGHLGFTKTHTHTHIQNITYLSNTHKGDGLGLWKF